MRVVRKDYFLDHDHSACVDRWDWELAITKDQRNVEFLKQIVRKIKKILKGAEGHGQQLFPQFQMDKYPDLPEELTFLHAEEILERYPDLPRKQRETRIVREYPAVFIIGIGWVLQNGYPHGMRAADCDDWATETTSGDGRPMHGLNGDLLVWNPVTKRRHELTSMGIRVTAESLKKQLEITGQLDMLRLPYHQAIWNDHTPLSIGGRIGPSRTFMLLLKKAHPRRSQRHRLAQNPQRHVQEEEHPRDRVEKAPPLTAAPTDRRFERQTRDEASDAPAGGVANGYGS